jgi:two-component system NarL family sensor kinase
MEQGRQPPRAGSTGPEPPTTVRAVVARFALVDLAAVLLLGAVAYLLVGHVGRDQAIEDAKRIAGLIGTGIVEPGLTADPEHHPGQTRRQLDALLGNVVQDPLVRVKVWTKDGTIVYSDEPRLIGKHFGLDPEEVDAIHTGTVKAELSDLSAPENQFERDQGQLLEVYFPITDPDGNHLLFESYSRYDAVTSTGRDIRLGIVPALLGALALLALVQIPLAARMARRIRDDYAGREALLRRAVDASDRERRRIAADLHDGVVQRMAGTTYSLDALAAREGTDAAAQEALREAASTTRGSIRELRTTLVEIYPASLDAAGGLENAMAGLLARLEGSGTTGELRFEADVAAVTLESQQLIYRVAQEALRNVEKHAQASAVSVLVEDVEGGVRITVADDGVGFDPEAPRPRQEEEGHLGLSLIAELVRDGGGTLEVSSRPGEGSRMIAVVPR